MCARQPERLRSVDWHENEFRFRCFDARAELEEAGAIFDRLVHAMADTLIQSVELQRSEGTRSKHIVSNEQFG